MKEKYEIVSPSGGVCACVCERACVRVRDRGVGSFVIITSE